MSEDINDEKLKSCQKKRANRDTICSGLKRKVRQKTETEGVDTNLKL